MTSRRVTIRTSVAFGVAAALGALLTTAVEAQFGGNQQAPYTPAKDAKDLHQVAAERMNAARAALGSLELMSARGQLADPESLVEIRGRLNALTQGEMSEIGDRKESLEQRLVFLADVQ